MIDVTLSSNQKVIKNDSFAVIKKESKESKESFFTVF